MATHATFIYAVEGELTIEVVDNYETVELESKATDVEIDSLISNQCELPSPVYDIEVEAHIEEDPIELDSIIDEDMEL